MKRAILTIALLVLTKAVFAQRMPSKARYVVIDKYPFSPFRIGDTIKISRQYKAVTFYWIDSTSRQQGSQIKFSNYPKIFRALNYKR